MKKNLLNEIKAMNKIAGTKMTKEQEISFIKNRLNELEFNSQKELDAYKKNHNVRPGTKLKVRSTGDAIANLASRGSTKVLNTIAKGIDKFDKTPAGKKWLKGVDWVAKKVQGVSE
jgi:hypothetical protein